MDENKPALPINPNIGKEGGTGESQAERIRRISKSIKVNTETTGVGITSMNYFSGFTETSEAIKKTNIRRLLDLGSGYRPERIGKAYINGRRENNLLEAGIEEYTGIDVGVDEDNQGVYTDNASQKNLTWAYRKSEALLFLANEPDNSAHIMLCGLESETTQGNVRDWSLEMFQQMKRVVPNGGIMCFQGFIFKNGVIQLSSLKDVFPNLPYGLPDTISVKGKRADGTAYEPSQFGLLPVEMTDIASGYKFVDEKLGVDWYFFAKEGQKRNFDGSVSEETISTAECHGSPFYLINKK
jgi:hypothetical protein